MREIVSRTQWLAYGKTPTLSIRVRFNSDKAEASAARADEYKTGNPPLNIWMSLSSTCLGVRDLVELASEE